MLRAPLQSSFTLQLLKVSTHHARPYIVFMWFAHLCSLRLFLNLKSLHHVTQPYAVSIVPEMLCSLRMNKSGKVFAYSFALAVSIHCAHLKSPTTSRAPISLLLLRVPLRSWCDLCALVPCAHYWRAGGIGLYMIYFRTAGRCPNQWAVHCRHVRRSHRRYTQIYSRRV